MALTKDFDWSSTVRTLHIAVVLYDSEYRDFHHLCHVVSFLNDHLYEILRRTYDHDSIDWKGLEYSKRYITCSRRHIYEEIVHFIPYNIGPELFYHVCKNRSSPNNRSIFRWKKKVDGHNLDSVCCLHRIDAVVICLGSACEAVHLWNGRSGDVSIQNTYFVSFGCHCICKGTCNEGFSYAALTTDNADHMFYI